LTYVGDVKLFAVIHTWDDGLALRYEVVIVDVIGEETLFYESQTHTSHQLAQNSIQTADSTKLPD
jgi:hypothetical protein